MNERKELPICIDPPYKTYGYLWFDDGIIMGNFKNSMLWILSNNLHISFSNKQIHVFNRESSFIDQGPLIVKEIVFFYHDVLNNPENNIRMIEEYVDSGYYIEGFWNEKAIKEKPAYQKWDFQHNYYIYGYDRMLKEFLSVGYTNSGQYSQFRFSYDEYIESLIINHFDNNRIFLSKVNREFECAFDPDKVRTAINDYLSSFNRFVICNDNSKSYGINAIYEYIDLLNDIASAKGLIDMRNSRILMEYKQVFSKAIKLLPEFQSIEPSEIDRIYNGYNIQHYLSLKYNLTQKTSEIYKLIELLRKHISDESYFLKMITQNQNR